MEDEKPLPKTMLEAIRYFSDRDTCLNFMAELRWPDGVVCQHCGHTEVMFLKTRRIWKCKSCRKQFTIKTGTILEDSPIALDKWLCAMWMLANCKNGVSSHEIARTVGVTQKSAWFMLQRLRLALQDDDSGGKLSGTVEVDETFIGGKARNMHHARKTRAKLSPTGMVGKVAVMGLLERHGRVRTMVVPGTTRAILDPRVRCHVEEGSSVYTDSHGGYDSLDNAYVRGVINHAERYVDGLVHTNGMENFWSLLKRGLKGTYVSVEPFHLFRYLDEQSFRFNNRKANDAYRFDLAVSQIVGKRLTYAQVTGKDDADRVRTH